MKLKVRIWIIVAAALLGLVVMAGYGLYQLRQSLLNERRAQIAQHLDFADAQLRYFHSLEVTGSLSREEAQSRAKGAIAAQRKGFDYFFIRTLTDDLFVYHPVASRMGKADPGERMPDGRMNAAAYREDLAKSRDNKVFMTVYAARPNSTDKTSYPKLVGVLKFEPWGWMPGIGFYVDDIDRLFMKEATKMLSFGGGLIAIVALMAILALSSILKLLGGEPKYAAECMRKIASGDLGIDIEQSNGGEDSMMASLKMMQMKLRNISAAIHENAEHLEKQVQGFELRYKSYAETKTDADFEGMSKYAAKIMDASGIFKKAVHRIKL
ncbi:Cache domain-containing protein [Formivibrio citricus]|uniref:Cache domain-containing protein n=1 Tax=Formivibrio citricus TaxID=83765 RepID=A0A1I5E2I9_9NEIS|nr:cache domain-containing protein [Formivibrio citricus]SFO05563.1 Cache domain-containing protein [Formivibrio citricus]